MSDLREDEVTLYPDLPVVDAHHHLVDRVSDMPEEHNLQRFLVHEYTSYVDGGHNVVGSVVVEARVMYRAEGPEVLRSVGETEFLNGQAAMAASGRYGRCRMAAGIVGEADLRRGDDIRALLEAHLEAAPGRFRGVRHEALWDADESIPARHALGRRAPVPGRPLPGRLQAPRTVGAQLRRLRARATAPRRQRAGRRVPDDADRPGPPRPPVRHGRVRREGRRALPDLEGQHGRAPATRTSP